MARRAFLSFVEEDKDLVDLFRVPAKNDGTDLESLDHSVKVPLPKPGCAFCQEAESRANSIDFGDDMSRRLTDAAQKVDRLRTSGECQDARLALWWSAS